MQGARDKENFVDLRHWPKTRLAVTKGLKGDQILGAFLHKSLENVFVMRSICFFAAYKLKYVSLIEKKCTLETLNTILDIWQIYRL